MTRPRVLYLTYDGLTDSLGQSQIIPYLNGLSQIADITVISHDKPDIFYLRQEKVSASLESSIQWKSLPYSKSPPLLSTFWDLSRMKSTVSRIVRDGGVDLIHVRSYPPMGVALAFKRKFKVPVIFDMRGFYADERVEGGIWNLHNPLYRFAYKKLKNKEKRYLEESDAIVSLTEKGKEHLIKAHGLSASKLTVIPCCADFDHFTPTGSAQKENSLDLVYLGSTGTWYLTEEMFRIFSMIRTFNDGAHLHIITFDDAESLYSLAAAHGLDRRSLSIGGVEKEQLPNKLAQMDIALCFIRSSFSKQASSPTKIGEFLSMGIPVICNKGVGDLDTLAQRLVGLESIDLDNTDPSRLSKVIEKLENISSQEIRDSAQPVLSLESGVERYTAIYRDLLSLEVQ